MLLINEDTNFNLFLKHIKELEDKLVLLAVRDTIGHRISDDQYELLKDLGLSKLSENKREQGHWRGYVAIIDNGKVIHEQFSKRNNDESYYENLHGYEVSLYSSPLYQANCCSITVNCKEYAVNHRGLNFVILDIKTGNIEESLAFDSWAENIPCYRDAEQRAICISAKEKNKRGVLLNNLNEVRQNLDIRNILGNNYERIKNKNKIKVRLFYWGAYNLWIGLRTVAEAFAQDDKFDVLVVCESKTYSYYKKEYVVWASNIKVINDLEYNIGQDCPDIAIYNLPGYYQRFIDIWEPKMNICIPHAIINGIFLTNNQQEVLNEMGINISCQDFCIVEKNIYVALKDTENLKLEPMGNPKIDIVVSQKKRKKELPDSWKKLEGRKVILWAFDHCWQTTNCTFDLYIKHFLELFGQRGEGLIIRPHANYLRELVNHHLLEEWELQLLVQYCEGSPNIVWDESLDYGNAYAIADAVITDINCGITISALPLDVPLAVLERYDGNHCDPQYPEVYQSLYKIKSVEDLKDFINMVTKGEHPMKQQQNDILNKYIANVDGENGQRIKEFIVNKYWGKINELNVIEGGEEP